MTWGGRRIGITALSVIFMLASSHIMLTSVSWAHGLSHGPRTPAGLFSLPAVGVKRWSLPENLYTGVSADGAPLIADCCVFLMLKDGISSDASVSHVRQPGVVAPPGVGPDAISIASQQAGGRRRPRQSNRRPQDIRRSPVAN